MQPQHGRVRVARVTSSCKASTVKIEGFKSILCMTKSTAYGDLSPYELRDPKGRIVENAYQFSKYYYQVPKSRQTYSRFDQRVIWEWPAENHKTILNEQTGEWTVSPEYLRWRQAGMNAQEAIRYPVGRNNAASCVCAFAENPDGTIDPTPLGYVEARKRIYLPLYTNALIQQQRFLDLQQEWLRGTNLLIIEVDGPHQESLPYYQEKYGAPADWIQHNSIECTEGNLKVMLNDTKHAFGHGYCMAAAIQGLNLL